MFVDFRSLTYGCNLNNSFTIVLEDEWLHKHIISIGTSNNIIFLNDWFYLIMGSSVIPLIFRWVTVSYSSNAFSPAIFYCHTSHELVTFRNDHSQFRGKELDHGSLCQQNQLGVVSGIYGMPWWETFSEQWPVNSVDNTTGRRYPWSIVRIFVEYHRRQNILSLFMFVVSCLRYYCADKEIFYVDTTFRKRHLKQALSLDVMIREMRCSSCIIRCV